MRRTVNGRRGSERAATGVVRAPALEHPVASQNCSATCRSSWRLRTPNGLAHNVRREPSPPGACAVHCWCVALKRCAAESCSRAVASDQECVVGASPAAGCVPLPTLNGASTARGQDEDRLDSILLTTPFQRLPASESPRAKRRVAFVLNPDKRLTELPVKFKHARTQTTLWVNCRRKS